MTSEGFQSHFWNSGQLLEAGQFQEALQEVNAGLSCEPDNIQLLVQMGEIKLIYHEEVGLSIEDGARSAVEAFDKVLASEPQHAEAWGGVALVYLYLEMDQLALDSADKGLSALSSGVGFGMTYRDVHINVAEALYDRKIRALVNLGRAQDARTCLFESLNYCPGSSFLTRHIDTMLSIHSELL